MEFISRIKRSLLSAIKPTIKTVIWLMKLMLPITLAVSILDFYGIILMFSNFVEPMFKLMGLSGQAAIVFITSFFGSIYAAIGVMAGLGFGIREVTILATMCLICHNMIIETKIQQKAGSSILYIVLLRVFYALFAGYLLNLVLPLPMSGEVLMPPVAQKPTTLLEVLLFWCYTILPLAAKIFVFVSLLNILQGILREFKLIDYLMVPLRPLMTFMGIPRSTTFLWIVANTLGLAYGGMVMYDELQKGIITNKEANLFNTSVAITHSLLEDSLLFVALGVGFWWVLIPRFVLSVFATWLHVGYFKYIKKV